MKRQIANPEQMTAALFELLRLNGRVVIPTDPGGNYRTSNSLVPMATELPGRVLIELVDLRTMHPDELAEVLYAAGRDTRVSVGLDRAERSAWEREYRGQTDRGRNLDPCNNPDCPSCNPVAAAMLRSRTQRPAYSDKPIFRRDDEEVTAKAPEVNPQPEAPKVHGRKVVGDATPKQLGS